MERQASNLRGHSEEKDMGQHLLQGSITEEFEDSVHQALASAYGD